MAVNRSYDRKRGSNGEGLKGPSTNSYGQGFATKKMDENLSPKKHPTESLDDELVLLQ